MNYSIGITTYNDEKEIIGLLNNICNQTVLPSEIIVTDGGSSDATISVIKDYFKNRDIDLKLITDGRLNISQGLNHSIVACSNELVLLTATGNSFPNDCFEKLIKKREKLDIDFISPLLRGKPSTSFSELYNSVFLDICGERIISNHCVLGLKSSFIENGLFYEKFVYAGEDEEFYNLANKNGYTMDYCDDVYVIWDTPHDFTQYRKQLKNYTLASMQIYPLRTLLFNKYRRQFLYLTLGILSLLLLIVGYSWRWLSIVIILGLALRISMTLKCKFSVKAFCLKSYSLFCVPFICIRMIKYSSDKYKVRRPAMKSQP